VARSSETKYVAWGREALLDLLRREHAVLWQEAQAKIADTTYPTLSYPIDPHHLTTARRSLIGSKTIVESIDTTRGGLSVPVLHLADTRRRKTLIATAAGRKRLLAARLHNWSTPTTKYRAGPIGEAGERVVANSIQAAAPYGLRYAADAPGEVGFLLGEIVEGGPLDGAVWADAADENGAITASVLCPIEVKNIRHWVYPTAIELYQVLYKAAKLQERLPDVPICPVLVTRRKSYDANQMSRDLGFRILDVHHQFVLPVNEVREDHFKEVKEEPGYRDFERTDSAHASVVHLLRGTLIQTATANAERWKDRGSRLVDYYDSLRTEDAYIVRRPIFEEMREEAEALPGHQGGW
jgi:hypothetical protein